MEMPFEALVDISKTGMPNARYERWNMQRSEGRLIDASHFGVSAPFKVYEYIEGFIVIDPASERDVRVYRPCGIAEFKAAVDYLRLPSVLHSCTPKWDNSGWYIPTANQAFRRFISQVSQGITEGARLSMQGHLARVGLSTGAALRVSYMAIADGVTDLGSVDTMIAYLAPKGRVDKRLPFGVRAEVARHLGLKDQEIADLEHRVEHFKKELARAKKALAAEIKARG